MIKTGLVETYLFLGKQHSKSNRIFINCILYLVYDLNILIVLAACISAGFLVAIFSYIIGQPSQKYGLPFPVILRSSFGISGARYIGMLRGVVGMFMF